MCGTGAGDDVVQDTFLAILRGGFDPSKGSVAGYLFGIARHHVIRRLEKCGAGMSIESDARSFMTSAPVETPIDIMAREELVAAVREAVEGLPPIYREVVVLCELEEMNYATVAEVIQCPIGTVRSRLHRARALLLADLTGDIAQHERTRRHG